MKKLLITVLFFSIVLGGVYGAGKKDEPAKTAGTAAASAAEGTHTVVDFKGNSVEVPNKIERIVVLGPLPAPTVLTVFQQGKTSNIVGVSPDSVNGAKYSIFSKYAPDFQNISSSFYTGGKLNMEELIKLKPDVVFYMDASVADPLRQAGIAAVALAHPSTGWDASPLVTLKSWMDTMAQTLQMESPAQQIIAYGEQVEKEIKARIEKHPLPSPNKILFISKYSDTTIASAGKKSFGQYWANLLGGINLGGKATQGAINMEQIYEWQPDQVFILTFSDKTPDNLYNNTAAPGHDWSGINAVKNRQVFKFPFGMHRWWPPTTDTPLAMWWFAKTARPDLFGDIDMNQKIKEYYKQFYNMTLTDADVEWILHPRAEAKRQYF